MASRWEWAREGATRRIAELKRELKEIGQIFPDLIGGSAKPKSGKRKRRRMSAAARAKISAAQKRRWAARRKADKE